MESYDIVVVGARCAGASTALLLARQGRRVLLVDKASFPSDTMSTLYIHPPGVARLARWGVLDDVVASGCPPLDTISHDVDGLRLAAAVTPVDGATAAYAPRRHVLDGLLVRAAVAAGAEFRDGTRAEELVWRDGRVTGVRLRTGDSVRTVSAGLVIGADGMRSKVAELADAPVVRSAPLATCVYYTFWSGLRTGFGFHESVGRWIARIPTHDDLTVVAAYLPQDEFQAARRDPAEAYLSAVKSTAPDLYEQLMAGERADRWRGTGDQRNYFRQAHGPGWALAGDAAHHLDSITARGITNALIQAELLAGSLAGVDVADTAAVDEATARFGRDMAAALAEPYASTLELAKLRPTKARLRMLRAVAASPELTSRYFALSSGAIRMREFMTADVVDLL
ncbi:FAD-dependent oxidoreductase [Streptomyces huiliensis]|uniref:FAD-dependent oxidoreductase n=1 Tax=Streptomyces huiliensis TaxID=2876027 RepID=UPI001CBEC939|nr:NAD(P)/FAD-dependent oxidoreductase [Streptomyces huiliensis]MBZ4319517.1 NAD(P)/FAD-dependent oxidoreductase [Streptomyces huiliensis]